MNMNRQGQSCSSTSRVFVHESLHDRVVERLVAAAEELPVGLPWEEGSEVGPLISQEQFEPGNGLHHGGEGGGSAATDGRWLPARSAGSTGGSSSSRRCSLR